MTDTAQRIAALHAWFQANVLPQRLTPEVERLWFTFFKQGYSGPDLAKVVRYLRIQISLGKRNEGSLKLQNLLAQDEHGSLSAFDADLALASSRDNLRRDKRLAPLPDSEPAPEPLPAKSVAAPVAVYPESHRESGMEMAERLREFRQSLTASVRSTDDRKSIQDPHSLDPAAAEYKARLNNFRKTLRGGSLIELLVVCAILGILSGLVAGAAGVAKKKAIKKARQAMGGNRAMMTVTTAVDPGDPAAEKLLDATLNYYRSHD